MDDTNNNSFKDIDNSHEDKQQKEQSDKIINSATSAKAESKPEAADLKNQDQSNVEENAEENEVAQDAETPTSQEPEIEIAALKEQLESLQKDLKEGRLRMMADMENLRRRNKIDLDNLKDSSENKFIDSLVPLLDSFELGLETFSDEDLKDDKISKAYEGMNMILKQFLDVLSSYNVDRINPLGEEFNPQQHEAISMQPKEDDKKNIIINVVQKGYVAGNRLIRPARVIVGS